MNTQKAFIGVFLILSSFSASYADHHMETTSMGTPETVVDIAINSGMHDTLVTAVDAAGLVETLQNEGPFTVFAPTDSAFAALPAGTVAGLLQTNNKETLVDTLTYHVLPQSVTAEALSNGVTVPTVQGESVTFQYISGDWYINNAKIIATNITAGNGIVHVIDNVIMPKMDDTNIADMVYSLRAELSESSENNVNKALRTFNEKTMSLSEGAKQNIINRLTNYIDIYIKNNEPSLMTANMLMLIKYEILLGNLDAKTVVDIAIKSGMHDTLVAAVTQAELVNTLIMDGPYTVFAPTDDAFAKLPDGTVESLLMEENRDDLTDILTYHVVAGAYYAEDIYDGLMLQTIQGTSIEFTLDGGTLMINGKPSILKTDILTSNGVVHVIEDVLMPSE